MLISISVLVGLIASILTIIFQLPLNSTWRIVLGWVFGALLYGSVLYVTSHLFPEKIRHFLKRMLAASSRELIDLDKSRKLIDLDMPPGEPRVLLASDVLDQQKGNQVAETLLRAVLERAQHAIEQICPSVLCSVKLLRDKNNDSYFQCIYPPRAPAEFDEIVQTISREPTESSYAGQAVDNDDYVFVDDWSMQQKDRISPILPDIAQIYRRNRIYGLVACPIKVETGQELRPAAVLEVVFTKPSGLVDDEITRGFLESIVKQCAAVIQLSQTKDLLLRDSASTLRRVAQYRLPPSIDQRLLWLGENKEELSESEQSELLELAEFAEERTLEKVQAQALLNRLSEACPEMSAAQ